MPLKLNGIANSQNTYISSRRSSMPMGPVLARQIWITRATALGMALMDPPPLFLRQEAHRLLGLSLGPDMRDLSRPPAKGEKWRHLMSPAV